MTVNLKKSVFFLLLFTASCTSRTDEVICTMEFRMINIKVNNATLDEFYTIRENTGDTIRNISSSQPDLNLYLVLDDNSQHLIMNRTENFRFIGIISDTVAVDELFSIKADQCHIEYVSGNLQVDL